CRKRASERDKSQKFHDDVFRWHHEAPHAAHSSAEGIEGQPDRSFLPPCNCKRCVEILTHVAFFDVEFLQKHLGQRRSQVIEAQLSLSIGAVRKSNANAPGGNSVTASNFVTFVICAADVDFSRSSHFGLRDGELFDSRAAKSSWTEVHIE